LLGALVVLGVLANVVMLNFCYDVSVKLHSSHLLAMTLFVAAADLRRLVDFFVLGRTATPANDPPLFATPRLRRGACVLMTVVVLGLVGLSLHMNIVRSQANGHLAPKPPLYGIWEVKEVVADGAVRPPLMSDHGYWLRATFDPGYPGHYPATLRVTRLDQSRQLYLVQLDTKQRTIVLSKFDDPTWQATLTYSEPASGTLVLQGMLDGRQVRITFRAADETRLPINQDTHWIRDYQSL
jgi:hypothetical protein